MSIGEFDGESRIPQTFHDVPVYLDGRLLHPHTNSTALLEYSAPMLANRAAAVVSASSISAESQGFPA